jgi:SAM-dependent methyltransferase
MDRLTKSKVRGVLRRVWPYGYFSFQYRQSAKTMGSAKGEKERLFAEFLSKCEGPCLQISVKDGIGEKFGPNWTSVDKYDTSDVIDRHDDIQALEMDDESYNAVVCWSVLEHVPDPVKAVSELHRVLKPGALVWVQVPFLYPFHMIPHDYWRVTTSGLRIWMSKFEEIKCACDYWAGTPLIAGTYFYGRKPVDVHTAV